MHTRPASESVVEFLLRIERADPNNPDIGEDDTDTSWGHQQFCGGQVQFDNLTWEGVSNHETAYQILAATVKTCHVARHLCFKRAISVHGGYLADMYLSRIVECLWEDWKRTVRILYSFP